MQLEVFYDSKCKFCAKRAEWIRRHKSPQIILSDINSEFYFLELLGINWRDTLDEIHVVVNGRFVVSGADAVRLVLSVLGYRKIAAVLELPIMNKVFDQAYSFVNKNRYRIKI